MIQAATAIYCNGTTMQAATPIYCNGTRAILNKDNETIKQGVANIAS